MDETRLDSMRNRNAIAARNRPRRRPEDVARAHKRGIKKKMNGNRAERQERRAERRERREERQERQERRAQRQEAKRESYETQSQRSEVYGSKNPRPGDMLRAKAEAMRQRAMEQHTAAIGKLGTASSYGAPEEAEQAHSAARTAMGMGARGGVGGKYRPMNPNRFMTNMGMGASFGGFSWSGR